MIQLRITGMNCQHCVNAVRNALSAVPGVTRTLSVDLNSGHASVEGDVKTETLIAAVKQAGYEATSAEAR